MIGNNPWFKAVLLASFMLAARQSLQAQVSFGLEHQAVVYLCENFQDMDSSFADMKIRFKGRTMGLPGDVYRIADCLGDIQLLTGTIPNQGVLDSLQSHHQSFVLKKSKITMPDHCPARKKFQWFGSGKPYRLDVFHAIPYNGTEYVELSLSNKNLEMWTICVAFKNGSPVSHCVSYLVY